MSDTKWRKRINEIGGIEGYAVRFRTRCVGDDDAPTGWNRSFPWHLPIFRYVEWLELNGQVKTRRGALVPALIEDFTPQIFDVLKRQHLV